MQIGEIAWEEFEKVDLRHRLPASAAPTVFRRRITLRPSSKVTGDALPAAGGGNREASGEEQQMVGDRCMIQRIFNTELGKNILQYIDELIFLPTLLESQRVTFTLHFSL